jgi:hypothetical protein
MQFIQRVLDLSSLLILVIMGGLAAYIAWWYLTFQRRFEKICHDAVVDAGSPLKDAAVEVHSVTAAPRPAGPSPYDLKEDDEQFCEDLDGQPWDEEGCSFYWIDATITPADPAAAWDPTTLSLVPADYIPDDEIDISEQLCGLHSAEIHVNGRFRPAPEKDVRGPQRLRMLFAVHDGLRAVKFALFVTYFGRVELPPPLPAKPKGAGRR